MTDYEFHVAFQSDAEKWSSGPPIALSYAWVVVQSDGTKVGQGQRPSNRAEQMRVGDRLAFLFVDTASDPAEVIFGPTIRWSAGPNPIQGQTRSPLENGDGYIKELGNQSLGPVESVGCNVRGQGWELQSPFPINHPGDFELTVEFRAAGKRFQVDPEMEVIR